MNVGVPESKRLPAKQFRDKRATRKVKTMSRILIVDDDEDMRGMMRARLSTSYEIFDTGEPESVLALTLEHRPDAILLDLSMPKVSGFELCRALSSLSFTKQIPIFVVSGNDVKNRAFCQNLGAVGYFTKPIDFEKLKTQLEEVIRSKGTENRADVRVALRVTLRLKGKSRSGAYFEVHASTENVSKGGFLCSCATSLDEATTVQVTLCGDSELDLGNARLVRVVTAEASNRYGFQFIGSAGAKLLE
jgi:DNA-binding response OmpR family regulator